MGIVSSAENFFAFWNFIISSFAIKLSCSSTSSSCSSSSNSSSISATSSSSSSSSRLSSDFEDSTKVKREVCF
ncbi:MAG: hypothetical protein EU539_14015 [Promethearchaeota archaeon]|nr:MAG: hypothetical protein EU539_14015 [Candidatus Lokiarchaeota archaeon]